MADLNEILNEGVSLYGDYCGVFTDKNTFHSYANLYDEIFSGYSHIKLLEIGVHSGGSQWAWRRFFNSYELWGVDILPDYWDNRPFVEELKADSNIHGLWNSSSTDANTYNNLPKDFDAIIDDGDHNHVTQFETIKLAWDSLKSGGIYIIEDVSSSTVADQLREDIIPVLKGIASIKVYKLLKNGREDDVLIKLIKV